MYEEARGMDDDEIIKKAFAENWVLITNDKDFGVREFVKEFTTGHQEKPASKMRLVIKVSWELAITILPALLVALFINVFVAEAALVEHRSTSNKCNTKTITISWA